MKCKRRSALNGVVCDRLLDIADAIIVSTAIETHCSYLITFDADFMRVGEIPVLTPQKFLEMHSV